MIMNANDLVEDSMHQKAGSNFSSVHCFWAVCLLLLVVSFFRCLFLLMKRRN